MTDIITTAPITFRRLVVLFPEVPETRHRPGPGADSRRV